MSVCLLPDETPLYVDDNYNYRMQISFFVKMEMEKINLPFLAKIFSFLLFDENKPRFILIQFYTLEPPRVSFSFKFFSRKINSFYIS